MAWDKHVKPPADVCPEVFCVMWVAPGGAADLTGRTYDTFQEAITRRDDWTEFPNGGCACSFGKCTRLDAVAGDHDWYEPNDLALKNAGLPWFYFTPSLAKLRPDLHEEYLRESAKLWGEPPSVD